MCLNKPKVYLTLMQKKITELNQPQMYETFMCFYIPVQKQCVLPMCNGKIFMGVLFTMFINSVIGLSFGLCSPSLTYIILLYMCIYMHTHNPHGAC